MGAKGVCVAVALAICLSAVSASHFRSGTIKWTRASTESLTVTFNVSATFRSDFITAEVVLFGDGTNTTIAADDWVIGAQVADPVLGAFTQLYKFVTHTYPEAGPYIAQYVECCRIYDIVNAGNQPFRVAAGVELRSGALISPQLFSDPTIITVIPGLSPWTFQFFYAPVETATWSRTIAAVSFIPVSPTAPDSNFLRITPQGQLRWVTVSLDTPGQLFVFSATLASTVVPDNFIIYDFLLTVAAAPPSPPAVNPSPPPPPPVASPTPTPGGFGSTIIFTAPFTKLLTQINNATVAQLASSSGGSNGYAANFLTGVQTNKDTSVTTNLVSLVTGRKLLSEEQRA